MTASSVTLAVVADIHNGPVSQTKRGDKALELLNNFIGFANEIGADAIVDLGDRVTDIGKSEDRMALRDVAAIFSQWSGPKFHILGNHDCVNLSRQETTEYLSTSVSNRSVELNGWRLIFWQADVSSRKNDQFLLQKTDLDWLAQELPRSNRPTVLFSHIPLHGSEMIGNIYFEDAPNDSRYDEFKKVRDLLRYASNVVLCVSGHAHWNDLRIIDGLPFLTVQSLTESSTTGGEPAGAMARLELGDKIRVYVSGSDWIELSMPLRDIMNGRIKPIS